jgi:thiamine transport system substrate-binding protein
MARTQLGSALVAATALTLTGCSLAGGSDEGASSSRDQTVVLVTHDSFAVSPEVLDEFTAQTGYTVDVRALGDAGAMVNQLVLSADDPLGDAVFGIDSTFASRAIEAGVLEPDEPPAAGAEVDALAADDSGSLTAIDFGDVCVNVDHEWFTAADLVEPSTLEDLADPAYRDLLVVEDPASSSPGLAFLLATVGAFGDDWPQYWAALADNGVKVAAGWSDAYGVDFSGSSGDGPRPLVVSYSSSPPYEVPAGSDVAPTGALLDTCFRQVEYAGVLAGAANPAGARALVEFMLSTTFQEDVPGQMYVYPAVAGTPLPAAWEAFAPLSPSPFEVPAADIAAHRQEWIQTWTDTVIG